MAPVALGERRMDSGAILAAVIHPGDAGDTQALEAAVLNSKRSGPAPRSIPRA